MSVRKTRKAGIPKVRHQDPNLQRTFDALIERAEVLDGLRGDPLDKAVTYRDLGLSGFTITQGGAGGSPLITNTPPGTGGLGGDGPGIGPAAAPANLTVTETFLALLAVWQNPSFNLQHIEVWRSLDDNLLTAQLIGTTVAPLYVDYVGELKTFYYWVRAVGTDGTFSAYNSVNGTVGTTGIDPSAFEFELNISGANLDAVLAARIDLIDVDVLQDSLMTRVAVAEGDIVTIDARTTSLESSATGLATSISGNTTAINANASLLATQQTSITTLLSDLGIAEGDIASNAASIVVNSSDILDLRASLGAIDSGGGQDWEFLTTVEGFVAGNGTLTHTGAGTGAIIYTPTGADSYLLSPTIGIGGGIFTQVVARVRQTIGGGTWEGSVTYTTGGHTASSSFIKTIPDPGLALNEWTTLTWDMSNLTSGGADWESSTITSIRLDLVSDAAGKFEVDWIIIAKFSTTALSEALSALDVRVTSNESGISAQATRITALESSVNDNNSGVAANASALSALTADVVTNQGEIDANSAAILALEATVNNGTSGVVANASAIGVLQTDVSTNDGVLTAHASDLTQLLARISGGYASIVNSLASLNANFGTSYSAAEIQAFADVGLRSGVAARIDTNANVTRTVQQANGARIRIDPNGIYEVRFSVYHNRPTDRGFFYAGMNAYLAATGGTAQNMKSVNNRSDFGSNTPSPMWLTTRDAFADEEWLDVTCYILGSNVSTSVCPNMVINGSTSPTGYFAFVDGYKVLSAPYVELAFLNNSASPTYGDGTVTTTYITNLSVHRIDSEASNYAAIQTEATVTANALGDLNALYSVKVELNSGGIPYVSGFGLTADVIDGVATSAFGIRADQFFIVSPSNTADSKIPFSVGLVNGSATVGINGQLIVDGTIRGTSILAKTIGAGKINVTTLDAVSANMGVLVAGTLTTSGIIDPAAPYYDPPDNLIPKYIPDPSAYRVEIQNAAATNYPLWYGSGPKGGGGGLFYVDTTGGVVVKGLLQAGMIDQSFFAPAAANNTFRIACDYPANYSNGVYSGKAAHLSPVLHANAQPNQTVSPDPFGLPFGSYWSPLLTFVGPTNTAVSTQYGRLGSNSEMITFNVSVSGEPQAGVGAVGLDCFLYYLYHSTPNPDTGIITNPLWRAAFRFTPTHASRTQVTATYVQTVITKETDYNYVSFMLRVMGWAGMAPYNMTVSNVSLSASTPNFGTADLTATDVVTTLDIEDLPFWPRLPGP